MAFCTKCGAEMADGAAFCPKCGQAAQAVQPSQPAQSGMAENVAGCLSYLLGWVTGIVFFLIDKRPFVRFHAAQSIVVFGGLFVLRLVIGAFVGPGVMMMGFGAVGFAGVLYGLVGLAGLVLWILLMVKAYQGSRFELPVVAIFAKTIAGK